MHSSSLFALAIYQLILNTQQHVAKEHLREAGRRSPLSALFACVFSSLRRLLLPLPFYYRQSLTEVAEPSIPHLPFIFR